MMDDKEIALRLLHLVEENYDIDAVVADYKKALTALTGNIEIKQEKVTGGRRVPILSNDEIQIRLNEKLRSASAVTTSSVTSF
jgi:hypothetical protein